MKVTCINHCAIKSLISALQGLYFNLSMSWNKMWGMAGFGSIVALLSIGSELYCWMAGKDPFSNEECLQMVQTALMTPLNSLALVVVLWILVDEQYGWRNVSKSIITMIRCRCGHGLEEEASADIELADMRHQGKQRPHGPEGLPRIKIAWGSDPRERSNSQERRDPQKQQGHREQSDTPIQQCRGPQERANPQERPDPQKQSDSQEESEPQAESNPLPLGQPGLSDNTNQDTHVKNSAMLINLFVSYMLGTTLYLLIENVFYQEKGTTLLKYLLVLFLSAHTPAVWITQVRKLTLYNMGSQSNTQPC